MISTIKIRWHELADYTGVFLDGNARNKTRACGPCCEQLHDRVSLFRRGSRRRDLMRSTSRPNSNSAGARTTRSPALRSTPDTRTRLLPAPLPSSFCTATNATTPFFQSRTMAARGRISARSRRSINRLLGRRARRPARRSLHDALGDGTTQIVTSTSNNLDCRRHMNKRTTPFAPGDSLDQP